MEIGEELDGDFLVCWKYWLYPFYMPKCSFCTKLWTVFINCKGKLKTPWKYKIYRINSVLIQLTKEKKSPHYSKPSTRFRSMQSLMKLWWHIFIVETKS